MKECRSKYLEVVIPEAWPLLDSSKEDVKRRVAVIISFLK